MKTFDLNTALTLHESDNEFPVDFDLAWKWLGFSTKQNAKISLFNSGFVEGTDLMITHELGSLHVPRPKERIYITVDCFKTWGMMANTEQGKQVRLYFLRCEKIAKQDAERSLAADRALYNDLSDRIAKLEANKPALPPSVPEMTRSQQVKELVSNYVQRMRCDYEAAWTMLYTKFGLLYNWRADSKSKSSKLVQIEAAGGIEELYQLALKIFI